MSAKPKPVLRPDDLLLLLVQHWARDESVFPTEDDRLDLATIMLFQSYTGCRPAELVHAPRGRGLPNPLEEDDAHDTKLSLDTEETACDDESDYGDDDNHDDSGYSSATGGDSQANVDDIMDCEDSDGSVDDIDGDYEHNSDDSDGTEDTETEDTTDCYTTKVNDVGEPRPEVRQRAQDPGPRPAWRASPRVQSALLRGYLSMGREESEAGGTRPSCDGGRSPPP